MIGEAVLIACTIVVVGALMVVEARAVDDFARVPEVMSVIVTVVIALVVGT